MFLFTDLKVFNKEIKANTYKQALKQARELANIKGRLRIISSVGNSKEYSLEKTTYCFSLTKL